MKFIDTMKARFGAIRQELKNGPKKAEGQAAKEEGSTFRYVCQWVYKLRSIFLAIPVAFAAVVMAIYNLANLPEKVQVYFPALTDGEWIVKLMELDRGSAVFVPLLITVACLVMMFCSRRVSYPWLISLFSLVLPLFMLFTSVFPG